MAELFVDTSAWYPLADAAHPDHARVADRLAGRAAVDWIDRHEDQSFTVTDAVSFVVMADRGIREALALDRHFSTAGFVRLPAD